MNKNTMVEKPLSDLSGSIEKAENYYIFSY